MTGPNSNFWALEKDGEVIGKITSAVYSPRLQQNIALAMVDANFSALGTEYLVIKSTGNETATVVQKPFFDPKKKLTAIPLQLSA
jgi:aminomethyltransferase